MHGVGAFPEDEHRPGLWQSPMPAFCRGSWHSKVKKLTRGHKAKVSKPSALLLSPSYRRGHTRTSRWGQRKNAR